MSNGPTVADSHSVAEEVIKELEQAEPSQETTPAPEPEAKPEPTPELEAQKPEGKEEPKAERPVTERKSQYVPVSKANAWRHEAAEAKAKAAELQERIAQLEAERTKAKEDDIDTVAREIAGEDANPEVVKRILAAVKKPQEPSDELKGLLTLKQEMEAQKEEQGFKNELTNTLKRFPDLAGHETELREIAYAEGNEKVPLELLAYKLRDELNLTAQPPSAEGKSARAPIATEPDYANVSEKEVEAMDGEELDRFIAWQKKQVAKRTGMRF